MSAEFKDKMNKWSIKHLLSPPYHPASNGLAERAVGIVKDRLKKIDVSAAPIPLHMSLQSICRIHGLTPHRSTGKCPYELIKEGTVTSLFPRLTDGNKQRCEKNAVSHSVGRLNKKTTFIEGEEVIIYDLKTKLSSKGKIVEVLGSNTYLADCGNGPQHISGDVISRMADVSSGRSSSSGGSQDGGHNNIGGHGGQSHGGTHIDGHNGQSHGGTHTGGHGGQSHGGSHAIGGGGRAHSDVGGQSQSIGGGHSHSDVGGQSQSIGGGRIHSDVGGQSIGGGQSHSDVGGQTVGGG